MHRKPDLPAREALVALIKHGLTRKQIAERLGKTYEYVNYLVWLYGLKVPHAKWAGRRKKSPKLVARDAAIVKQIAVKKDAAEVAVVGRQYNLSKERVYQILARNGITRKSIAQAVRPPIPETADLICCCFHKFPDKVARHFQRETDRIGLMMRRPLAAGLLHFLDSTTEEQAAMLGRVEQFLNGG